MRKSPTATCALGVAILISLGVPVTRGGDLLASKGVRRVVEGQVTDARGQPARGGKIAFGPQDALARFTEAALAGIDADGHFRIELGDFPPSGTAQVPADGPLRYLVLSPGYQVSVGKVAAGAGPTWLDIRLEAKPWKTIDVLVVDHMGKPVAGAEVAITFEGYLPWTRLASDLEGRCRIAMAADHPFGVSIRREGYLPASLPYPNNEKQPSKIRIRLLEPIRGRVVDAQGRPLSGIRIGRAIGPDFLGPGSPRFPKRMRVVPPNGMMQPEITDEEGRFVLRPTVRVSPFLPDPAGELRNLPQAFCFTDEDFRRFAFLSADFKGPVPDQEIVLKPGRLVRVPIEHEVEGPSENLVTGWNLTIVRYGEKKTDASLSVMGGLLTARKPGGTPKREERIETYFPEGRYRLGVNVNDPMRSSSLAVESAELDLTIAPGDGPLDLPPIRLSARPNRGLIGKPAPEIEATDLDTHQPVRLAGFRGKVLVLEFWGYWCGTCIDTMPELAKIHSRFKDQPVVILAVHDQSIQSHEEYDRKLASVKHQHWEDRDLPFRVALDRANPDRDKDQTPEGTGLTCKRYRVMYFPTLLVIDQQGNVAGSVHPRDHERLDAMIQGLLAKAPSR